MKTNKKTNASKNAPFYFSDAMNMIAEYVEKHKNDPDYLGSEYYDAEAIRRILSNPKCQGIRIFNAIRTDEDGQKQNRLILAGVDENNKIILDYKTSVSAVSAACIGSSIILERRPLENGIPCPPCE